MLPPFGVIEFSILRADRGCNRRECATLMRIAYLVNEYPKVSHTFIRREILELERRGHQVLRLSIRGGNGEAFPDPDDQREAGKTTFILRQPKLSLFATVLTTPLTRPRASWRAARTAWRMGRVSDRGMLRHGAYLVEAAFIAALLRKRGIGHIHVHFGTNGAAVTRLVKALGGPTYSLTVHGPIEFDAPVALSLGDKVANAAFIAAISRFGSAQIMRWSDPEHWSRIHRVGCTVDPELIDAHEPVPSDSRTLLSIGRLSAQKGQMVLLDAFAQLIAQGEDARLVLAGDGELREAIERRISELGLRERVEITGWVNGEEIRRRLLASRGMVLPSFAEGLPVVIMEAFALGRPVISTYVAGIPELVKDGENGWLVPAGSIPELADAMRAMLRAPSEELTAMGLGGREAVRQRHLLPTEVDKLERLLMEAASCAG